MSYQQTVILQMLSINGKQETQLKANEIQMINNIWQMSQPTLF